MTDSSFIELDDAMIDVDRERRCGFSEVVYGESKTADMIRRIALAQLERGIDVFATRVDAQKAAEVLPDLRKVEPNAYYNDVARTLRVPKKRSDDRAYRGKIAILTAGTSDLPVAEEARETVLWTGADAILIQDVGVAGPKRLIAKLPLLEDADAIVVVAGMEGALPSVVGGYVSAPIIAVPTSVGYGAAFGGVAALLGMMNSCASNVTVVNIDAGFKAGYVAGLIAKRVADAVNKR
ncbi:MAG: nickel pincer cofactor biosynthesis protein LarB [Thermoguttaceae bacterium]|nr:nickel pincer cofactor biosynthesis protein LarB [Thermoguttaceae bacterium]MBR4753530.1 nickel pincer cofactor biosynthesis protein LarB [Thermoguttaceae bacterium]MBR5758243.1 nickel pincer cofactor biosynthesis protein LarB [Thermoguttaceae bacterium]